MPLKLAVCFLCSLSSINALAQVGPSASPPDNATSKESASQASPVDKHRWLRLNLGISLARGGDDISYVKFDDGRGGKTSAGHGSSADIGLYLDIKNSPVNVLFNVGFKGRHRKGENMIDGEVYEGKATLERLYLDGIVLYQPHRHHRLGIGFSAHIHTELDIDTGTFKEKREYDNALGYLVQYEYIFKSKGKSIPSLGLRYYGIEYEEEKISSNRAHATENIDASNTAIFVNYTF